MNALLEFAERGGPVMIAIIALSVVLYSRCFKLLLTLHRSRRLFGRVETVAVGRLAVLQRRQEEVRQSFQFQRVALGAMIAAAPLLGLLGTVSGMVKTFESLASRGAERSMEGLARGISEVLVATESGLAVAIPALLLVYLAHREVHRRQQMLNSLEARCRRGVTT